jgi:hypothetical protein
MLESAIINWMKENPEEFLEALKEAWDEQFPDMAQHFVKEREHNNTADWRNKKQDNVANYTRGMSVMQASHYADNLPSRLAKHKLPYVNGEGLMQLIDYAAETLYHEDDDEDDAELHHTNIR